MYCSSGNHEAFARPRKPQGVEEKMAWFVGSGLAGDRPGVVPEGAVNFAFIGQFAESRQRDCIFTTEYSVRTPMEAVYTLLEIERGVPEVFNSTHDIRLLLAASGCLRDGRELDIPGPAFVRSLLMKELDETQIGALLREFKLAGGD